MIITCSKKKQLLNIDTLNTLFSLHIDFIFDKKSEK